MKYKGEIGKIYQVNYKHIKDLGSGRHLCLRYGNWCWSNLWEYPKDLIYFIKYHLEKWRRN